MRLREQEENIVHLAAQIVHEKELVQILLVLRRQRRNHKRLHEAGKMPGEIRPVGLCVLLERLLAYVVVCHARLQEGSHGGLRVTELVMKRIRLTVLQADDGYGGRLPVHVRCLIDEAANIGQIPNLEKLIATMRSREISACLVLQAKSQLKAIYKDNADTIIGNCDSQLFLGGTEPTTLKDLSEALGKETIDSFNTGESRGREQSHSLSYQKLGHELLSKDELAVMDGGKCILQLRGVRPFLSDKYDLTDHPNYHLTDDTDPKRTFDIERFLEHRAKMKGQDEFEVVDAG